MTASSSSSYFSSSKGLSLATQAQFRSLSALCLLSGVSSYATGAVSEYALIQLGTTESNWTVALEADLIGQSDLNSHYFRQFGDPGDYYSRLSPSPSLTLAGLSGSIPLRFVALEGTDALQMNIALNSAPSSWQASDGMSLGVVPVNILFEAPYSSASTYTLWSPMQFDQGTSATFDMLPLTPQQTDSSSITFKAALSGQGDLTFTGGGDVTLETASPSFAGAMQVGVDGTLHVKAPLQVQSLTGLGEGVLEAPGLTTPSDVLTFLVPSQEVGEFSLHLTGASQQRVVKSGAGRLNVSNATNLFLGDFAIEEGVVRMTASSQFEIIDEDLDTESFQITSGPLGLGTVKASGENTVLDVYGHLLDNTIELSNGALLTNTQTVIEDGFGLRDTSTLKIDSTAKISNQIALGESTPILLINASITSLNSPTPADLYITQGAVRITGSNTYGGDTYVGTALTPARLIIDSQENIGLGGESVYIQPSSHLELWGAHGAELANTFKLSPGSSIGFDPEMIEPGDVRTMSLTGILTTQGESSGTSTIIIGVGRTLQAPGLHKATPSSWLYRKNGDGTLVLQGESDIPNGSIEVMEGVLRFDAEARLGPVVEGSYITTPITLSGENATLDMTSALHLQTGPLTGVAGTILDFGAAPDLIGGHWLTVRDGAVPADFTFSGNITGGGYHPDRPSDGLIYQGEKIWTLSGVNTEFGGILGIYDTAKIVSTTALQAAAVVADSTGEIENQVSLSLLGSSDASSNAKITGDGSVNKVSDSTLTYGSAQSTYSGGTTITIGRVNLIADSIWDTDHISQGPFGISSITVGPAGVVDLNGHTIHNSLILEGILTNESAISDSSLYGSFAFRDGAFVDAGSSGKTLHLKGIVEDGNGQSGLTGPSTFNVSRGIVSMESLLGNTYTGMTLIGEEFEATLKISQANHLPSGAYVRIDQEGTLDLSAAMTSLGTLAAPLTLALRGELNFHQEPSLAFGHNGDFSLYADIHDGNSPTPVVGVINVAQEMGVTHLYGRLRDYITEPGNRVAGSFAKTGLGELQLTGLNDLTGTLHIVQGRLSFSQMARWNSLGTIALGPQGTLDISQIGAPFIQNIEEGPGGVNPVTLSLKSIYSNQSPTVGGDIFLGANSLEILTSFTDVLTASIHGTGSLIKHGGGVLALYGDNTHFEGSLKVGAGCGVVLGDSMAVKTLGSGDFEGEVETVGGLVNIQAGKSLYIRPQELNPVIANLIEGDGSLVIQARHAIGDNSYADNTVTLSGASRTYAGGTVLEYGILKVDGSVMYDENSRVQSGPLGLGSLETHLGTQLHTYCEEIPNNLSLAGVVKVHAPSDLGQEYRARFTGDTLTLQASGSITVENFSNTTPVSAQILSKITGNYGISKDGDGVLWLSNPQNDYTGDTSVIESLLILDNQVIPRGNIHVGANGFLMFVNREDNVETISGNIEMLTEGGYTGAVYFRGGAFKFTGDITGNAGSAAIWAINAAGNYWSDDLNEAVLEVDNLIGLPTIEVDGTLKIAVESGLLKALTTPVSGSGSLKKYGPGALNIGSSNSLQYFSGTISAYEGVLDLSPSTILTNGDLFAQGAQIIHTGFSSRSSSFVERIVLASGSVLDLGFTRRDNAANTLSLETPILEIQGPCAIVLRPEWEPQSEDSPLLNVTAQLNRNSLDDLSIQIAPSGLGSLLETAELKLIRLGGSFTTDLASTDWLLSRVQTSPLYSMDSVGFDGEYLICHARKRSLDDVFLSSNLLSGMSLEYQSFGKALLSLGNSSDSFAYGLGNWLATSSTDAILRDRIMSAYPSALRALKQRSHKSGSAMTALDMSSSSRSQQTLQKLMKDQGVGLQRSSQFAQRAALSQIQGTKALDSHIAHATNPADLGALKDYQSVDLKGMVFSTTTSYSHEAQLKQSEDNPGYTSSTWSTSIGASYSSCGLNSLGAIATTSHTRQKLNPNQADKTDLRSDRYNNAGMIALFQPQSAPFYGSGVMTYGQHNYAQDRTWIQEVGSDLYEPTQAHADYKAHELYGALEVGSPYRWDQSTQVIPFVGLAFSHMAVNAYEETAVNTTTLEASLYGMIVPQQVQTSQDSSFGLEVLKAIVMKESVFQVRTRLGYTSSKRAGDTSTFTYAYTGAPEVPITVESSNPRQNTCDLSINIHAEIRENLFISGAYTGQFGKDRSIQSALLSVEYYLG